MAEEATVDRPARRRLALLARQFASRRMNNHEFDERAEEIAYLTRDRDWGIYAVYIDGLWPLYDDFRTQTLTEPGHRLSRECRRHVARCVLFLQTDLPYEWPYLGGDAAWKLLLERLTRGRLRFPEAHPEHYGEPYAWPFLRRADLEEAARHPRLLRGKPELA